MRKKALQVSTHEVMGCSAGVSTVEEKESIACSWVTEVNVSMRERQSKSKDDPFHTSNRAFSKSFLLSTSKSMILGVGRFSRYRKKSIKER